MTHGGSKCWLTLSDSFLWFELLFPRHFFAKKNKTEGRKENDLVCVWLQQRAYSSTVSYTAWFHAWREGTFSRQWSVDSVVLHHSSSRPYNNLHTHHGTRARWLGEIIGSLSNCCWPQQSNRNNNKQAIVSCGTLKLSRGGRQAQQGNAQWQDALCRGRFLCCFVRYRSVFIIMPPPYIGAEKKAPSTAASSAWEPD